MSTASAAWRLDPTGCVDETDPTAVCTISVSLLQAAFPDFETDRLRNAFTDFVDLADGAWHGHAGLDTPYHDLRHTLACAHVMARLLAAHAQVHPGVLGSSDALLGMVCALFHDAGYIRHESDDVTCGAALTSRHVSRGGALLQQYADRLGLVGDQDKQATDILHYTGWERSPEDIVSSNPRDHALGQLLGTADILGQTADPCYPEKCRDLLWQEFCACGIGGAPKSPHPSATALLRDAPAYQEALRRDRLDGLLGGVWRLLDVTMGAPNPWIAAIDRHVTRLRKLIAADALDELGPPAKAVLPPFRQENH